MLKSLHIGRYTSKPEDFRKATEFLAAIGLERVTADDRSLSLVLSAPLGLLSVNTLPPKYAPEVADRLKDVAQLIVLEVTNPDDVYAIAQRMELKILADGSLESGRRSFTLELPGEIVVTVHGQPEPPIAVTEGNLDAQGKRFGIVVSRFNAFITERLLTGAMDGLIRSGASADDIRVVRVPGSFEIPAVARALAVQKEYDAIICLGCLLRGDTAHYDVIVNEVTRGIGQSAQETGVPHAFGVLTCDTLEQAIDRAGLKMGNKGFDAALAAVEMASLKKAVNNQPSAFRKKAVGHQPSALSKTAKPGRKSTRKRSR
ncbi:MAG TPA: 6,7-dimethyl-8-ribityllumazine synthase [Terriglobales bacterium]